MSATMVYLTVIALLIAAVASATPPAATTYSNHTVGGASGWFFNTTTNTSAANYSSWTASQTFNLGDYLIFNTNTNLTVIQTSNETTYRSCSTTDDGSDDWFQYDGGSNQFGQPLIIAVPLISQGMNYYFSDADDGIQCQQGMAFEILVKYGLGLPPSLNQPPPPPYVEPPTPSDVPSPPVAVATNQPTSGGLRPNANLRWVVRYLLFGACVLFV